MVDSVILTRSVSSWIRQLFSCMGGCLGCCTKPTPITAVDEPSKGLRIQGRTVRKPSVSEDFWSTTTYEMDNSGVQSQRSVSSISTSTQTLDHHGGAGSTSNPPEFVNHGLLLWNQTRQQWIAHRKPETRTQQLREPRLSWNATYDSLLASNKPFPRPIPLAEMIDFLVDVWEQEGLGSFGNALMNLSENLESEQPTSELVSLSRMKDYYKFKIPVPGLSKEELEVTVDDRYLVITGEHKEEEGGADVDDMDGWYSQSFGYYNTSLLLPDDAKLDEIKAASKNGVLSVTIPRPGEERKNVREIKIQ